MADMRAEYEFDLEQFMENGVGVVRLDDLMTAITKAINAEKSKVAYTLSSADKVRIADNTKARLYKECPMLKTEWIDAVVEEQIDKYEAGEYSEWLTEENLLYRSVNKVADLLYEKFEEYFVDYFD